MDSEKELQGNMHERKKIAKSKMITLCSVLAIIAIVLDQVTKYLEVSKLKDGAAYAGTAKRIAKEAAIAVSFFAIPFTTINPNTPNKLRPPIDVYYNRRFSKFK